MEVKPIKILENYAEGTNLSDDEVARAEEYLVRVRDGASVKTSAKTFDVLRLTDYINFC